MNFLQKFLVWGYSVICIFGSCTSSPKTTTGKIGSKAPIINLGDTAQIVTLEITLKNARQPKVEITDLAFDKTCGIMFMKDDGIITDYSIVYQILNGGTVNGRSYPGYAFDDGTGKQINYKYSFAINTNDEHSHASHLTGWDQMAQMVQKGHSIMNHTMYHGGSDKLKGIKDAEKNLWNHIKYRMTELVIPGNAEGFTESALELGYNLISSEFGEPATDGNNEVGNENISWGSFIRVTTQNLNKILVSRTNLGDKWNSTELANSRSFIDYILKNPEKHKKIIGTCFSHGPFSEDPAAAKNFDALMSYLKNHPNNNDSVWITSSKELMDYLKTKEKLVITQSKTNSENRKFSLKLDFKKVHPNVIWRNTSIKLAGNKIKGIKFTGANSVTFNEKTGLINIYKLDRSRVINPSKDVLPPQIINLRGKGKKLTITYDRPVVQTKISGYEVSGNTITALEGSGTTWQLSLKAAISKKQLFNYRMQYGNAVDKDHISRKVCTYTDMEIEL